MSTTTFTLYAFISVLSMTTSALSTSASASPSGPRERTWSYATFWSPYFSYWPIVYEIRNPFASSIEPAQNRLFPSHPKKRGGGSTSANAVSFRSVRPEHRQFPLDFPDEHVLIDKAGDELPSAHRLYSYMSSSPSPYSTAVKATSRLKRRSTSQLPISSTSVVFPSASSSAHVQAKASNTSSSTKGKGKRPSKTEGKLVLEGLSFLGSLLKPTSGVNRPLFSPASSLFNRPLFGSTFSGLHSPLFASSASVHHPLFTSVPSAVSSPTTSQTSSFHQFSPQISPISLPGFAYPGPSALYPDSMYPPYPLHSTNPYYPAMPSPYQALSVDNLLVPLVGMVGLNLLRPDIIRSRREGGLSDIDGIDVFRHISQDEECLRRLACEVGVTVADDDNGPAIKKALERALAAKRLVPNRHLGQQSNSNKNRLHCGRHSCELWRADDSNEPPSSDDDHATK